MSQDRGYGREILHRSVLIHLETPGYVNRYISVSHYSKENINGSYFHICVSAQKEGNVPIFEKMKIKQFKVKIF